MQQICCINSVACNTLPLFYVADNSMPKSLFHSILYALFFDQTDLAHNLLILLVGENHHE